MASRFGSRILSPTMDRAKFTVYTLQARPFHHHYTSTVAREHHQWQLTSNFHKILTARRVYMSAAARTTEAPRRDALSSHHKASLSLDQESEGSHQGSNNCAHTQGKKREIATLPDDQPLAQQSTGLPTTCLPQNRLILIDGKAIVYRAYYKLMAKLQHGGHVNDTSGDSDWVLTVFTALSTVLKICELTPSHIAVVFDHEGLTFRHTMFSNYKLNRSPTPDTVVQSLRYIKPALMAMGIRTVEVPGVEADDVIGTLAVSAIKTEAKVRVVSPDKDFFQLISPSLRLLRFVPRGSGIISFGLEEFQTRFGDLNPSQFVDILALTGDKVDNIPGIPGIGEKTAVKLIKLYGSLENLVKERNNIKGKLASSGLLADKGEVFLSKRLVTLRTDLPQYIIPLSFNDFLYKRPPDGGERFYNLISAMGSFVHGPFVTDLEKRTRQLWARY